MPYPRSHNIADSTHTRSTLALSHLTFIARQDSHRLQLHLSSFSVTILLLLFPPPLSHTLEVGVEIFHSLSSHALPPSFIRSPYGNT